MAMADETEAPEIRWTVNVTKEGVRVDTDLDYMALHFWMSHALSELEDQFFAQIRKPV
jgi:hypothetical protein